jgi:hypothetical protein
VAGAGSEARDEDHWLEWGVKLPTTSTTRQLERVMRRRVLFSRRFKSSDD